MNGVVRPLAPQHYLSLALAPLKIGEVGYCLLIFESITTVFHGSLGLDEH